MVTGSRTQVMHGTADKTTGGLVKSQLKYNKHGRIVSIARSKSRSPALIAMSKAVKTVSNRREYAGTFHPLKKGTRYYKDVMAEYRSKF